MSVSDTPTWITYFADGQTVAFPWPYYVSDPLGVLNAPGDLVVTGYNPLTGAIPTPYLLNHDYTFSGTPDPKLLTYAEGGEINFNIAPVPPLVILISRRTPLTQPSVWQPNDPFKAGTLEAALDRLMLCEQERRSAGGGLDVGYGPAINDNRPYRNLDFIKNLAQQPGGSIGWMYLNGNWYLMPTISL